MKLSLSQKALNLITPMEDSLSPMKKKKKEKKKEREKKKDGCCFQITVVDQDERGFALVFLNDEVHPTIFMRESCRGPIPLLFILNGLENFRVKDVIFPVLDKSGSYKKVKFPVNYALGMEPHPSEGIEWKLQG